MKPAAAASACAACALAGVLLSGPVALAIVAGTHPQPPWSGPAAFAASFHPVQTLPYFAGLLLVGGFVGLIAALHGLAAEPVRTRTRIALAFAAAFGAMVFVNYAIQTTFVPALLSAGDPAAAALAGSLSMANPLALGWALEMWGYGLLGVATWLAAPVFLGMPRGRITAALFVVNGPLSIIGALATALWPGWVLTPAGIWAFALWNLLVVAMAGFALVSLRGYAVSQGEGETGSSI